MSDIDRLASIAIGLAVRIRDDEPEANLRWLRAHITPEEMEAFVFVLGAAIPIEVPWSTLTAWTVPGADTPRAIEARRKTLNEALRPRRAAA